MNHSGGGGGGGGSGGLVRIDAPSIAIDGAILANGGGGASGAPSTGSGMAGGEPDPRNPEAGAFGGLVVIVSGSGRGGDGNDTTVPFAGATPPVPVADIGGGGGGGGGGYIVFVGTRTGSGIIVPPP